MPKRKADDISESEGEEPPRSVKKVNKRAKLEEARRRAAFAMQADKKRVDAVLQKNAAASPDGGTKQSPKKKASTAASKKTTTPARNGRNQTASSSATQESTGHTRVQSGGVPTTTQPTVPTASRPTPIPMQSRMNMPPQGNIPTALAPVSATGALIAQPPRNVGLSHHQNFVQEDVRNQRPMQTPEHEADTSALNSPMTQVQSSTIASTAGVVGDENQDSEGAASTTKATKKFSCVFIAKVLFALFVSFVGFIVLLVLTSKLGFVDGELPSDDITLEIKNLDAEVPISCPNDHYQVYMDRTCVLTQRANETIGILRSLLIDKTVADQCGGSPSEAFPLFSYYDLQLENPQDLATYHLDSDVLGRAFALGRNDEGSLLIGLPEDFRLPLDLSCQLTRFFRFCLASLGTLFVLALQGTVAFLLGYAKSNPLASFIIAVVVLIFVRRQSNRAQKARLLEEISKLRAEVFARLQDDLSRFHVAAHLQHEFAPDRHTEKKEHKHFMKNIWPRVVSDIRYDNRIRNTTQIIDGEPKEVWQWVAAPPSAKKSKVAQ